MAQNWVLVRVDTIGGYVENGDELVAIVESAYCDAMEEMIRRYQKLTGSREGVAGDGI